MANSASERIVDVIVVGAGPAGLAAATTAATRGAQVTIVDAGPTAGGQYWRHPAAPNTQAKLGTTSSPRPEVQTPEHLHRGLDEYRCLVQRLSQQVVEGQAQYLAQHEVWSVERDHHTFVAHALDRSSHPERAVSVAARRLILAPGAYDRQIPFPGWTLPGVLTAGGAQALLKGNGVRPGPRIVVAGTGPFLLPVAAGLARGGATVVGVDEAAATRAWLSRPSALMRNVGKIGEVTRYLRILASHRVPVRTRSMLLAARGNGHLEAVTIARVGREGVTPGSERQIRCDTLAVGWGFTPQMELPLELGCKTRLDADGSVVCTIDDDQATSVQGVFAAGEICGVGGATLAMIEGRIAGAAAAGQPLTEARLRRQRAALRSFATAMHKTYPVPSVWKEQLTEDTTVCRCEEVSVSQLRRSVELGATDARAAKLLSRPGMGWCQARMCGYAVACLTATWSGTPYQPELTSNRPVATPLSLGALADSDGLGERPEG